MALHGATGSSLRAGSEDQHLEEACRTAIISQLLMTVTISQHPFSCLMEMKVSISIRACFLEWFGFISLPAS